VGLLTRKGQALIQYMLVAGLIIGLAFALVPLFKQTNQTLITNSPGGNTNKQSREGVVNDSNFINNFGLPGVDVTPLNPGDPNASTDENDPTGSLCGPFGCGTINLPSEEANYCGVIPGPAGVLMDGCWICSHSSKFWMWEDSPSYPSLCADYWYSDTSGICASQCDSDPPFFGPDFVNNYCYVCTSDLGLWQRRGYNVDTAHSDEMFQTGCTQFWQVPSDCRDSNISYEDVGCSGVPPVNGSLVNPISGQESCWICDGSKWINTIQVDPTTPGNPHTSPCTQMWLVDETPIYTPSNLDFPDCGCASEPPNNERGPDGRGINMCWVCNGGGSWIPINDGATCDAFWINDTCPAIASSSLMCGDGSVPYPGNPDDLPTLSPGYNNCWLCSNPMEAYFSSSFDSTSNPLFNYGVPCNIFWVSNPNPVDYPSYVNLPNNPDDPETVCANTLPLTDGVKKPGIIKSNATNRWGCWMCDASTSNYSLVSWLGGRFNFLGDGPPSYTPQYKACNDFWVKGTYSSVPASAPAPLTCGNSLPTSDPGYGNCLLCTYPTENYFTLTSGHKKDGNPLYTTYGTPCADFWYVPDYPAYVDIPGAANNVDTVCANALPNTDGVKKPGIVYDNANAQWGCWMCADADGAGAGLPGSYSWVYWNDGRFDHTSEAQFTACHDFWMKGVYPTEVPPPPAPPTPTGINGTAWTWGDNRFGQLGMGSADTNAHTYPVQVTGNHIFTQVEAGGEEACGLDTSGQVWCWGNNDAGQLGNGSAVAFNATPVAVSQTGITFTYITVGCEQVCAIDTLGDAYCWGDNSRGQLGDGTNTNSSIPKLVSGGHKFISIEAGNLYTCGIDTSHQAWCWGYNSVGQLGNNSTTASSTPVQVSNINNVVSISLGGGFTTLAIDSSGQAWAWGNNNEGQFGNNTEYTTSNIPVQVLGGHTFAFIDAAQYYSCAIDTTGKAYCWGSNTDGQLGTGDYVRSLIPKEVAGGHTFTSIFEEGDGGFHTCAVDIAGQAWCWGKNAKGQLGNGSTTISLVPVPVAGGFVFSPVHLGCYNFNVALETTTLPAIPTLPVLPGASEWMYEYGGTSDDLGVGIATYGGYIYVLGQETSDPDGGSYDMSLMKVNPADGTVVWKNQYGGASGGYAKSMTIHGGYIYATGYNGDIFLIKINPADGTVVWKYQYGGALTESGDSITADGSYIYVTGNESSDIDGGNIDIFVMKVNPADGTVVWMNQYGGASSEAGNSITTDGSYIYVTGVEQSDPDGGSHDIFVMKVNPADGTVVWKNQYGGADSESGESITTYGGFIYVTGSESSDINGGNSDIFVMKVNPADGTVVWNNQYGGTNSDVGNSLTVYGSYIYVTGFELSDPDGGSHDIFVMKVNPADGTVVWKNQYGGVDQDISYAITTDGNYIYLTGREHSDPDGGNMDIIVMSIDVNQATSNIDGWTVEADPINEWTVVANPIDGWTVIANPIDEWTTSELMIGTYPIDGWSLEGVTLDDEVIDWSAAPIVLSSSNVWGWGFNDYGQIGDGTTNNSNIPKNTLISESFTFDFISTGGGTSCGEDTTGKAWCWGNNTGGQLGDGTSVPKYYPVEVLNNHTFKPESVIAGTNHSCGIDTTGKAWCWGSNTFGQLGDGTNIPSNIPVQVSNVTNFTSISTMGTNHTCAIDAFNKAWCWGNNAHGELGDGSYVTSNIPVSVSGGPAGFSSIGAGNEHTCGVDTTGKAWCWGNNAGGQLGDGTTITSNIPISVFGGYTYISVSPRDFYSCGVEVTGKAYCWGNNTYGQLGNNSLISSNVPVQVSNVTNFVFIKAAAMHTCGLDAFGKAWCWGYDDGTGCLGDGNTVAHYSLVPQEVSGGLTYTFIDVGFKHTIGSVGP